MNKIYLFIALIGLSFCMTSCGDDDDEMVELRLDDLDNGIYNVMYHVGKQVVSKQVVISK